MRGPLVFIAGVTDSENPSNPLDRAASVVRAVVELLHDSLVWRDRAAAQGPDYSEHRAMHETTAMRLLLALGFEDDDARELAGAPVAEVMTALTNMGTGS